MGNDIPYSCGKKEVRKAHKKKEQRKEVREWMTVLIRASLLWDFLFDDFPTRLIARKANH